MYELFDADQTNSFHFATDSMRSYYVCLIMYAYMFAWLVYL